MEPPSNDQRRNTAENGADFGQSDELIIGRSRYRGDGWAVESIVASA